MEVVPVGGEKMGSVIQVAAFMDNNGFSHITSEKKIAWMKRRARFWLLPPCCPFLERTLEKPGGPPWPLEEGCGAPDRTGSRAGCRGRERHPLTRELKIKSALFVAWHWPWVVRDTVLRVLPHGVRSGHGVTVCPEEREFPEERECGGPVHLLREFSLEDICVGHLRRGPVLCPESASALSVTYGAERLPVEVQQCSHRQERRGYVALNANLYTCWALEGESRSPPRVCRQCLILGHRYPWFRGDLTSPLFVSRHVES
ncbi:hypothetical protein CB1_000066003 [Camelus ferus]|nr:hypothetical protein CB1_000066003 [Camelus ferus]